MNSAFSKSSLFENPFKGSKKSIDEIMSLIAFKMGQRALSLYEHIKAYRQSNGDLKQYTLSKFEYKTHPTQSNVCAKILSKKMKAFKCFDCIFENNSIMCVECFQHSEHKGHVYEVVEVHGGCCDCGDEEKWDPKGFCTRHNNSNLVNDMKKKVDPKEEEAFIEDMTLYFVFWFVLYNDAELYLKEGNLGNSEEFMSKMKEVKSFGQVLLSKLIQFNKDSLISNIMTFDFLTQTIKLNDFELVFCPKTSEKYIYEVILHMTRLASCAQLTVNMFTQLFPLKDFRRMLTISFFNLHHDVPEFSMSEFNHLSCQLLTSHKTISELVTTKQIKPLVYRPNQNKINSFQELAQNFVRYYIDIEYLISLYKGSSLDYINYHIMSGEFPSLGYYKEFSYDYEEAVNYYGIEEIRFARVIKLLKILSASKNCLPVLEKAIVDSWKVIFSHYNKWNKELFQQNTYETASIRNIYLTHQTSLAITVFVYFQKLEQQQPQITEDDKMFQLMKLLGIDHEKSSIQKIQQTLQVLNNHLVFAGLCLGHQQTMDRHYTFFSFTFKKSYTIFSSTLFLYKITFKILQKLYDQANSQAHPQKPYFISDQFVFERPLKILQKMFDQEDFKEDDQSIFDRKKSLVKLAYFLHLIIQVSQTDTHELILASFFDLPSKKQKYEQMLNNFYLQVLKTYKKMHLKQFKKITDEFIHNQTAFEKFLTTSKDIVIQHGNISEKTSEQTNQSSKTLGTPGKDQNVKIETQLNYYYFKAFKSKLVTPQEQQFAFKVPPSENHFLHSILSDSFIQRLLKILSAYIDIIAIKDGKIKDKQSGTLGYLVIQIIKIQKALKYKPNNQTSLKIISFFKSLKENKTSLSVFTKEVIRIICSEFEEPSQEVHESLKNLTAEDEKKTLERKKKLQLKKQKLKSKYKQNQQKFEGAYAVQLEKIKQQMVEQRQFEFDESVQSTKQCIVCKESQNKGKFNSDLMLMSFMQLSDVYEHFLKGKDERAQNCHLVFKSCGHYIHQSCHQKINKNKEYSYCQLCKSPVNCLLTASLDMLKNSEMTAEEMNLLEKNIVENLSLNFSLLFAMDDALRQDCENGFGQVLTDKRDIKYKMIESLVINTISSAIINKDENGGFYEKKQFETYQNILHSLRIFARGEEKELIKDKKESKRRQLEAQRQKTRMNCAIEEERQFREKTKMQESKQKRLVIEITYMMESYLRKRFMNFIEETTQETHDEEKYLSKDCVEILNQAIEKLIGAKISIKQAKQQKVPVEEDTVNLNYCPEIKLLREQMAFYTPPKGLNQIIEMRGKCPNCNLFNNHIFVCVICQWKGCKNCKQESISKHTATKHAGNSIFIEADLGNLYLVTKKKYWIFSSVYTDYLGEGFKHYVSGIKLDKYSLSEQKWNSNVTKIFLDYEIDTRIRYEEHNTKRAFTIPI